MGKPRRTPWHTLAEATGAGDDVDRALEQSRTAPGAVLATAPGWPLLAVGLLMLWLSQTEPAAPWGIRVGSVIVLLSGVSRSAWWLRGARRTEFVFARYGVQIATSDGRVFELAPEQVRGVQWELPGVGLLIAGTGGTATFFFTVDTQDHIVELWMPFTFQVVRLSRTWRRFGFPGPQL